MCQVEFQENLEMQFEKTYYPDVRISVLDEDESMLFLQEFAPLDLEFHLLRSCLSTKVCCAFAVIFSMQRMNRRRSFACSWRARG